MLHRGLPLAAGGYLGLIRWWAALWLIGAAASLTEAAPVSWARREAAGVGLFLVDVDLNDPQVVVSPALAWGRAGRVESFASFLRRLRPAAAINGTYFSRRNLRPVGDVVIQGRFAHFGGLGTALAFAADGVDVIRLPKSRRVDWSDHRAALAAGPLLVWEGFAKPAPGGEGFGDPRVFARAAPQAAVGITRDNHLLLVATVRGASLGGLARAMAALGAVYAINLDGGSSVALSCQGKLLRSPGRVLTNILAVYLRPEAASRGPLRPPRGLDWRAGHSAPPRLRVAAQGVEVTARLPREWRDRAPIRITVKPSLPAGWAVELRLDGRPAALVGSAPAEVALGLSQLRPAAAHDLGLVLVSLDRGPLARGGHTFRVNEAGALKPRRGGEPAGKP